MATLSDGIYALLKATAGVTSLLGSGDAIRAYPTLMGGPEGSRLTLPALMFEVYRDQPAVPMGNRAASVSEASVRFEAHASTPEGATAVLDAVYAMLKTYSGTTGTVVVQGVICDQKSGRPDFDDDLKRFTAEAEYTVFYNL